MHQLRIVQVGGSDAPCFQVERLRDGKRGDAVNVPSPLSQEVFGIAKGNLLSELTWYLEKFLNYPFHPETDHAEHVTEALQAWGRAAFLALFNQGRARDFYREAVREGAENLQLQIASDDPRILSWPWEALSDPDTGDLSFQCGIERCLNDVGDPTPIPRHLSQDRVNVLLVICRPYENDVGYRSVARLLVEVIERQKLPVHVTVLRPPTFDRLREVLAQERGKYHIVHFDGHGGYGEDALPGSADPHRLRGAQGRLVFETADGAAALIDAKQLRELLREYQVPAVVLNACQSAKLDEHADDAFASVAASLIKGGVRSVVAMSHSLYVSAAQQFLPAFYQTLFEQGSASKAVRAGRRELLAHPERVCVRGTFRLNDWMVPVLYQQEPLDFSFVKQAAQPDAQPQGELPLDARDDRNPYGFFGRDEALLNLERAMRSPPAGILIHGLGGVGKTSLARRFLKWLSQTNGLGERAIWFGFQEIRSAEYVVNTIASHLHRPDAMAAQMGQKLESVVQELMDRPFVLVWDNFESVCGIEGTAQSPLLNSKDQSILKELLSKLRGGKTKVIITSRGREDWLGAINRYVLELGGLRGEERWEFCRVLLHDLGRKANQSDPDLNRLMESLGGHPLMMRVVLSNLERMSAADVLRALRDNVKAFDGADEPHKQLFATLKFVEQSLPEQLRPLLVPLALFEHYVNAKCLKAMSVEVSGPWTQPAIDELLTALEVAGLALDKRRAVYELHPALTYYLRSVLPLDDAQGKEWSRALVGIMAGLASQTRSKELNQQTDFFALHGETFHRAVRIAETLKMDVQFATIIESLAAFALITRSFETAQRLYAQLGQHCAIRADTLGEAASYHQLGTVLSELHDFKGAEQRYLEAFSIYEKAGDQRCIADTCHQLGMVAQLQGDLDAAERWYERALQSDSTASPQRIALTHHQLGMVAQLRHELDAAERWYRLAVTGFESSNDRYNTAKSYHQLGMVALERPNPDVRTAEQCFLKAVAGFEGLGDEHAAAFSYAPLGQIALTCGDFEKAERWFHKALAVFEKSDDLHRAAIAYEGLGALAQKHGNFDLAQQWYEKALEIAKKYGDRLATIQIRLLVLAQHRAQS